jgi:hypothetical protein
MEDNTMEDNYTFAHSPMFRPPRQYAEARIRIMEEDFYVKPTREEKLHLYTLKTEIAIDNACQSIIDSHWYN